MLLLARNKTEEHEKSEKSMIKRKKVDVTWRHKIKGKK